MPTAAQTIAAPEQNLAASQRFSPALLLQLVRALQWPHQLFIALVLVQCVYIVCERIVQLALFVDFVDGDTPTTRAALWFFGIIVIAVFFVAYYAVHAMLTVNLIELIVFRVLTAWLLVRVVVGYATSSGDCTSAAKLTCLGFLAVEVTFNVVTMGLSVSALKDLQWKRYKAIGAETRTRALYAQYERFSAFRKVDIQFSIVTFYTVILYTAMSFTRSRTAVFAFGASIALVPIEIAWDALAKLAIKKADPYYVYVFWALSVFLPVFICSMAWDVTHDNGALTDATSEVLVTVAVFSALALVNRVGTVVSSVFLFRAFNSPQFPVLQRILSGSRVGEFQRSRLRQPRRPARNAGTRGGGGAMKKPAVLLPAGGSNNGGPVAMVSDVGMYNPVSVLQVGGQPPAVAPPPLGPPDVDWELPLEGDETWDLEGEWEGEEAGVELPDVRVASEPSDRGTAAVVSQWA